MNNMKRIQIITFQGYECDSLIESNKFLLNIDPDLVLSVTPLYNTILGGIDFTIVYYKHIEENPELLTKNEE